MNYKNIIEAILSEKDLELILNTFPDAISSGYLFEAIAKCTIIAKCFPGIDYTKIYIGQLESKHVLENINDFLKEKYNGSGGNIFDITIENNGTLIPFSIKYREPPFIPKETDAFEIKGKLDLFNIKNYKIGLILKDKQKLLNHHYVSTLHHKNVHDDIIYNKLLFDQNDVKIAILNFVDRFKNTELSEIIRTINGYLGSNRIQLKKRLHQQLAYLQFIQNIK